MCVSHGAALEVGVVLVSKLGGCPSKCEGIRGGARCSHASSRYVGKLLSSELVTIWGRGVLNVLLFVSIVLLW